MTRAARRLCLEGRVQAVGFRPFTYRLATELGLSGWVSNGAGRVVIEVDGEVGALDALERRLIDDAPTFARPRLVSRESIPTLRDEGFRIAESARGGEQDVHIPPDVSVCDDCRRELYDPNDRRHRYPFINCTQCGPRSTIITALPYDRARTTMEAFSMCPACRAEYEDPGDRRFHAEPIACPVCGPRLIWEDAGEVAGEAAPAIGTEAALAHAIEGLRAGRILGVQGIGGYHLVCDATNEGAVQRLRADKRRPSKPFALMVAAPPGAPLAAARALVHLDPEAEAALLGATRPIVLARRRAGAGLAAGVAPGVEDLGVMLAYSPLHDLLLEGLGRPVVATSGNRSGEPIAHDAPTARAQLGGVVAGFVHHDRGIVRPIDDAVVREIAGAVRPLRLGRGLAPLELELPAAVEEPVLALGGHQKNTIAFAWGRRVVVSPHLGDLDGPAAVDNFERTVAELGALFEVRPARVLVDAHPDYASSRFGRRLGPPVTPIWHHHAHASALAGEAPEVQRWLTLAWDGVGLGPDGTMWGGEALLGGPGAWRRVASFIPLRLVGAGRAGRESWRSAAALSWAAGRPYAPPVEPTAAALAHAAWRAGHAVTTTSAVGRLFDAGAALALGRSTYGHEAQGPMELEAAAARFAAPEDPSVEVVALPLRRDAQGVLRSDPAPLAEVLADPGRSPEARAAALHASLVEAALAQVEAALAEFEVEAVGLCGGVFQNRWLTERLVSRLAPRVPRVVLPRRVPTNDGGLAFGQLVEHTWRPR